MWNKTNKISYWMQAVVLGCLLCVGMLSSCKSDEDTTGAEFSASVDTLNIPETGSVEALTVLAADGNDWTSSIDKPWVQLTPATGSGTTQCSVKIDNSVEELFRNATIRLMDSQGNVKNIKVVQSGHKLAIVPETSDTTIENSAAIDKRSLKVKVTTNVKFTVKVEYEAVDGETSTDWLTFDNSKLNVNLEYGKRPVTMELTLPWDINTYTHNRKAKVTFVPTAADGVDVSKVVSEPLTVTQKGAPEITDDRAGDSLALITIAQRLGNLSWDTSQNMQYWSGVTLWEASDPEAVANPDMVGRVREAGFSMVATKESIPFEVKFLKYAETLSFTSNENPQLLAITVGSELSGLKYLKNLSFMGYGVQNLSSDLAQVGKTLEFLDMASNTLTSIPSVLTKANFPAMKRLKLNANRITSTMDMRNTVKGLVMDISGDQKEQFVNMLRWDTLDSLALSVNYLYGSLPTDQELLDRGFMPYKKGDTFKDSKGTHEIPAILIGTPKVLPNTKYFAINLNFLTGELPKWVLYHPHLDDWAPFTFIFNQESGYTKEGKAPGFSNEPANLDYYYKYYPWKKITTDDSSTEATRLRKTRRK